MTIANSGNKEIRGNNRVALALSGGVDSAVAAFLLQQEGFDVSGVFMKTYEPPNSQSGECPWKEDQAMALRVAQHLKIPFVTWNFEREYDQEVLGPFREGLAHNSTPNPDVSCNTQIKFGAFLKKAKNEGFNYIATGHYAQTFFSVSDRIVSLSRGADANKDQTYFLCRLRNDQLSNALFPIGHLQKKLVREIARKALLPNAERPDSQGICFVGSVNMQAFIQSLLSKNPGKILDERGEEKGVHQGLHFYTIGQRYGIGLGGGGNAWYVARKDQKTNSLIVVQGNDHPMLFRKRVIVNDVQWVQQTKPSIQKCLTQIRYRQQPVETTLIEVNASQLALLFDEPQRAPTPGQVVAFYEQNTCLGGAIITDCELSDSSL